MLAVRVPPGDSLRRGWGEPSRAMPDIVTSFRKSVGLGDPQMASYFQITRMPVNSPNSRSFGSSFRKKSGAAGFADHTLTKALEDV